MPTIPHRDRARPKGRGALIATVAALTAALVVGPVTVPAWAASPGDTAVTPKQLPADSAATRVDPLGAPASSTLISSDKLLVQPADATHTATAYTASLSGAQPVEVATGPTDPDSELHANFPTASGRFVDDDDERVLALHFRTQDEFASLSLEDTTAEVEPVTSVDNDGQDSPTLPTWSTPLPKDATLASDLAVGDLDRAVTEAGNYGDEAAVAHVDGAHQLHVAIVDYNQPGGLASTDVTGFTDDQVTGMVGVEIADFNGNSENEIAVVYQNSAGAFKVAFISYVAPDQTTVDRADATATFAVGKNVPVSTVYAVAAGDFAGLGKAQLAVSYTDVNQVSVWMETAAFKKEDFTVASSVVQLINDNPRGHDISTNTGCAETGSGRWCSVTHRLEPAFLAAGSDPSATDRRQVMFAYATMIVDTVVQSDVPEIGYYQWRVSPYTCYYAYGVNTASVGDETLVGGGRQGATCLSYADESFVDPTEDDTAADRLAFVRQYPHPHRPPVQLAPGGYAGRDATAATPPRWGAATVNGKTGQLTMLTWAPSTKTLGAAPTSLRFDPTKSATLTAYDQDNSSLRVGVPLVIEVPSNAAPVVIAAAPPVHMDWLYDETTGESGLDTYSWSSNTFLSLETEKDETSTTTVTTDTATSIGVGESASVKTNWEAGLPFVGATDLSFELKGSFSKKSEEATVNDNESSSTISRKSSSETINDDLLVTKAMSTTVFRYPVIGAGDVSAATGDSDCGGTCHAFFDVAVPSSTVEVQADVAGKSLDWYQPTWLNGNLLSYPEAVEEPGAYSVITAGKAGPKKAALIDKMAFTPGGVVSSKTITVSEATGEKTTVSSDLTFAQSVEAKESAEAKVGFGVNSSTKVKLGQSFDAEQRFGGATIGSTDASSSQSLRIQVDGTSADDYDFTSYYYYDKAGVQKLSNAVNIVPAQNSFWTDNYGDVADPALNLPHTIDIDVVEGSISQIPRMTTRFSRQEIRGFEVLQASPNGPQDAVAYASAPVAGDQVTFGVPVHNFSLVPAENTTVSFFAVRVDAKTGMPLAAPVQIGSDKTLASLDARGIQTIYSDPWTATGTSGPKDHVTWNVFVQLNRNGDPKAEVHPLRANASGANTVCPKVAANPTFMPGGGAAIDSDGYMVDPMTGTRQTTACASNNQGFHTVTVVGTSGDSTPAAASIARSVASTATPIPDANVHLVGGGFDDDVAEHATLTETSQVPELQVGVPVKGYVTADADATSASHQTVLVYDGLPEEGGKLLVSTTLQGIGEDGEGHAHFMWTPKSLGRHQLYQKIVGEPGAGNSDAQIVTVDVVPAGTGPSPVPTEEPSPSASPSVSASSDTSAPAAAPAEAGRANGLATTGTPPVAGLAVAALGLLLLGAMIVVLRRRARLQRTAPTSPTGEHPRE